MTVGNEDARMTELHGAVGGKAAVLPTTEAAEESLGGEAGAEQGREAVTGEGWSAPCSRLPRCLGPDPGPTFLLACTQWPLSGKRSRELANGS